MWDQQGKCFCTVEPFRIIPTYVGSTQGTGEAGTYWPNHSHVCGINLEINREFISNDESFPRMWDQLCFTLKCKGFSRIIPTYVGSTSSSSVQRKEQSNHSHVCGINMRTKNTPFLGYESFPRMWDQQSRTVSRIFTWRIIPTYVGSTDRPKAKNRLATNHSHVCGINSLKESRSSIPFESFPRMWDQRIAFSM